VNLEKVDWPSVFQVLSRRYTVVQPILRERAIPGAVVYRDLPVRRYMALVACADLFVGGTSGGSHLAAAFDVPSVIIVWRDLHREIEFPVSGQSFKSWFLYPQHSFVCAEDIAVGSFNKTLLSDKVRDILETGKSGIPVETAEHSRRLFAVAPEVPRRIVRTSSRRFVRIPGTYGELQLPELAE
jgi:hypothetical protein